MLRVSLERAQLEAATTTGGEGARATLRLHERQLERQAARATWLGLGLANPNPNPNPNPKSKPNPNPNHAKTCSRSSLSSARRCASDSSCACFLSAARRPSSSAC